jgi:rod shape determining protein RodA
MQVLLPSILISLFSLFNLFGINQGLFIKQLLFFIASYIIFFIVKSIGFNFFKINSKLFYWLFVGILIITFIIGIEVKGSKRWLDLYFFNFQASEFFKLFFIFYLSEFLSKKNFFENDLFYFFKSILIFIPPIFLIFKQPDLGNASIFIFIYLTLILFSKIPKKILASFFLSISLLLPFGWFFMKNYQRNRLLSFFSPHLDTQGTAYNMIQAVITIGSGKFFGRGLGLGTQSRLFFLPENTTDFAYASLVEQFGFFGGFLLMIFFAIIIYVLIKKILKYFSKNDHDSQQKFLFYIGILIYFVTQIFVNIGMNMGLLPVAGVALPLVSYGGSSALAFLVTLSLL